VGDVSGGVGVTELRETKAVNICGVRGIDVVEGRHGSGPVVAGVEYG